jgi:uncharacterized YceG family protein
LRVADGERTPEEREVARLERERRRAAQSVDPEAFEGDGYDGAHDEEEVEVPLGTRRVARRERAAAAGESRPARPRRPPKHAESRFGRRRSILGAIVMGLAVIPVVAAIWFAVQVFQPFGVSPHGRVTVIVPAHSSARRIGDILARDGVVPSGFFFDIRALLAGDRGKLRAGTYTLRLDMSYSQALKILITPPPAAKVSNLTIVEGRTRRQIDALLRDEGVGAGYLVATRHSRLLNPTAYGAPRGTPSLEGFLFPSTYQLRDPIQISALVADQLKTFKRQFARVNLSYARSKGMTPYEVLIIASIVEKEAGTSHDFPLVASVIYNRLHDHIPLGMDSTTRYEFNDYTKPLTQSQLSSRSPYNTRTHDGLVPTPIDNPGLSAIQAAANPARTKYLYFVVKVCGNGQSVFESNYAQFLRDSARYQSARASRGGNSPTHC